MEYSSSENSTSGEASDAPSPTRAQRGCKYNFRVSSVMNRQETETRKRQPRTPKPKTRPPPLSKYRRKTANARERVRMQEVNDAFDQLRSVIPQYPAEKGKITKITTLTLALNYIKALREVLGYQNDPNEASSSSSSSSSPSSSSSDACASPCSSTSQADYAEGSLASPNSQGHGSGLDSEGESLNSS